MGNGGGLPDRMKRQRRSRSIGAVLVALLLLAGQAAVPVLAALPLALAWTQTAEARYRSHGYSLPHSFGRGGSSFFHSRTPSFGSASRARTPSFSGGYSRPNATAPRAPAFGGGGAGDRAFSRGRSAEALHSFQSQQEAPRRPSTSGGSSGGWSGNRSSGWSGSRWSAPAPRGWYAGRGWSAPGYAYGGPSHFGIWNGLFLWFLLDHLSRPGYAAFFHNHQDDPGYRQWRAQAEQVAQNDPAVQQKLGQLDQDLTHSKDQPRDPSYLPPGVPASVAKGEAGRTPSMAGTAPHAGTVVVIIVVLAGGAVLVWLAWRRHAPLGGAGGGPPSAWTNARRGGAMNRFGTLGAMLRHKLGGEAYTPERVRVGMTITADPTPFLLAAGKTKVRAPEGAGQNLLINVQAVGRVGEGAEQLARLYLPDGRSMFQLHFNPSKEPDESRYFSQIDEVTPADAAEWAAWLDPQQGMIGWPQFQTKDGKLYDRVWAPGASRIEPYAMTETIESASGAHTVQSQSMLYGAPSGLAPPAPQTEYILVTAVDSGAQAWVEISAGIDINPAALALS